MSFLHALSYRRNKLRESGDLEALKYLPTVTCFERNSVPGGVWRSANKPNFESCNSDIKLDSASTCSSSSSSSSSRHCEARSKPSTSTSTSTSTNMYEGLWINGCKEALEYSDYTFDDHFGCPMPVFLPRAGVLEYMLARVTQHEDIFQNHVLFNTTVVSVVYDDEEKEFVIMTRDEKDGGGGVLQKHRFDKCIYSGGMNGSPKYAEDILSTLQKQNFTGQIVHSAQMNSLESSVKGKRIVMIGDSYSAEDLTLQCLKLGATKIYITSRKNTGTASYVKAWPGDRVEFLWYQLPFAVQNENTLLCRRDKDDDGITSVPDVDIVIFCTGYKPNFDMLSPDLYPWHPDNNGEKIPKFSVPTEWKMKENTLTSILGDVLPPQEVSESSYYVKHKLYKRMLISNTNMMYLFETNDYPLLDIDVAAWLCLAHICGETEIPPPEEMRRRNREQVLEEMQSLWRYNIDCNYRAACDNIPADHWYHDTCSEMYKEYIEEWGAYQIKVTARDQIEGGYPYSFFESSESTSDSDEDGKGQKPNDMAKKYLKLYIYDSLSRYELKTSNNDNGEWRTFRDCDPSNFASMHTGTEAIPFKAKWMELDDRGENSK